MVGEPYQWTCEEEALARAIQSMAELVGVHTVRVLLQRALWEVQRQYAEAGVLHLSESGVGLLGFEAIADPARRQAVASCLLGVLRAVLSRLVGPTMAGRMLVAPGKGGSCYGTDSHGH